MTTRLRSGVLTPSSVNGQPYYFGYLIHPSMEYEVAIAIKKAQLKSFEQTNKLILPTDEPEYRFGTLLSIEDRDRNNAYTCKVFADGKLHNLVIYPRQYNQLVTNGHSLNAQHEGRMFNELTTA
jgi:hypothetical protein